MMKRISIKNFGIRQEFGWRRRREEGGRRGEEGGGRRKVEEGCIKLALGGRKKRKGAEGRRREERGRMGRTFGREVGRVKVE